MSKKSRPTEPDSVYVLKLIIYFLLGAFWLRVVNEQTNEIELILPVGLVFGLVLASHDHFAVDRKIEYAVLLIATALSAYVPVVGFWL